MGQKSTCLAASERALGYFFVVVLMKPLIYLTHMIYNQQFLQNLYDAFNKREIETLISAMQPDVKWANGLTGGFVYGRDAVREYWLHQFTLIQPQLEPLKYETDELGREVVTVHQIIKDLQGDLLADRTVQQIFTIANGLISLYEIGETETIHEAIQQAEPVESAMSS